MQHSVVKTAGRVFEVLEYFREVQAPLSVREISEQFGYPLSSTSVLIKSLATLGYLSYDQSIRAYFPTVRVASLGDWIFDSMISGRELVTLMDALCEATGETVVLAVANDIFAQYVRVVPSSQHAIQFHVPCGTRRELCFGGFGWALLGQECDESIEKTYQRTLRKLGKSERRMSLVQVLNKVRDAREKGYAFSRGYVTEGAGLIAMPLPVGPSGAKLALGVAGVLPRMERNEARLANSLRRLIGDYRRQTRSALKAANPKRRPAPKTLRRVLAAS